ARRHGTPVSCDLNYRDSLWKSIGGKAKAQEVNRELVRKVDLLLGNEEDFSAILGVKIKGVSDDFAELPIAATKRCYAQLPPSTRTSSSSPAPFAQPPLPA